VKLFTCELCFKKFNGVLFKFLIQKFHFAKASHILYLRMVGGGMGGWVGGGMGLGWLARFKLIAFGD
jgi:hypothetical protein